MDHYKEYLFEKKLSRRIKIFRAITVILGVLFVICGFVIVPSFSVFIAMLVAYGEYYLLKNMSAEYEYIFTNGELDIDIVIGKNSRKAIASLDCRDIEYMARAENSEGVEQTAKKIRAVYDESKGGIYNVVFASDGVKALLVFQPPVELVEEMFRLNPLAVHK